MDVVQYEQQYVHAVYEAIGDHFNATRYRAWPQVDVFLEHQAQNAIVFDNGAGNGKYALSVQRQRGYYIAGDRCRRLLRYAQWQSDSITSEKHMRVPFECVQADCLFLPFRKEAFDVVLSIAVIHHMATPERRIGALVEMQRVLRFGGRALIYVWAQQAIRGKLQAQAQRTEDGWLLPWHRTSAATAEGALIESLARSTVFWRFYHLFEDEELRQLVEAASDSYQSAQKEGCRLLICRETFDHQNYVIEFEKQFQQIHQLHHTSGEQG
jgi:ubiquinone/menaquinone biosynthesis C-methylase UbiE